MLALDMDMTPTMGMRALFMGIVAAVVGGMNSIAGMALAAFLISLAQHLGVWNMGAQWQDAIAFLVLLAFLYFRPRGVSGGKVEKSAV
jgi:branched-subunit amino acid ABC-type transport system permease component